MRQKVSYALAGVAFLGLIAVGTSRWRSALPEAFPQQLPIRTSARQPTISRDRELAEAEELIVSNDPFRLANEPTAVRYDPAREDAPAAATQVGLPRLRPNMVLKAVIGGPPWQAIVDGIPGQPPGTIVRAGSTFDQIVVRAVTRDSIIIKGADTTWILSFRRGQ